MPEWSFPFHISVRLKMFLFLFIRPWLIVPTSALDCLIWLSLCRFVDWNLRIYSNFSLLVSAAWQHWLSQAAFFQSYLPWVSSAKRTVRFVTLGHVVTIKIHKSSLFPRPYAPCGVTRTKLNWTLFPALQHTARINRPAVDLHFSMESTTIFSLVYFSALKKP